MASINQVDLDIRDAMPDHLIIEIEMRVRGLWRLKVAGWLHGLAAWIMGTEVELRMPE